MGDLVSQGRLHVQRGSLARLIDVPMFLARLNAIAANTKDPDEATFVSVFMTAWESSDDREFGMQEPAEAEPAINEGEAVAATESADEAEPTQPEP